MFLKLVPPPLKLILSLRFGSSLEMVSDVFSCTQNSWIVRRMTHLSKKSVCHTFRHFLCLAGCTEWSSLRLCFSCSHTILLTALSETSVASSLWTAVFRSVQHLSFCLLRFFFINSYTFWTVSCVCPLFVEELDFERIGGIFEATWNSFPHLTLVYLLFATDGTELLHRPKTSAAAVLD
jgi:hypothetical protein